MLETKTTESVQSGLELDIRAFELEIEKEIDSLFIPVGNEGEIKGQAEPPSMEIEEPKPVASPPSAPESLRMETSPLQSNLGEDRLVVEPATEAVVAEAAPAAATETEELTLVLESPDDSSHELEKLIEAFQASYLSLDWDFSRPNVSSLAEVLTQLEPHCLKMPETESIYKILKAALQRVSVRPESVSPEIVEVMREAQGLLKRFLLIGRTGISSGDRADLKALISRVQAMRNVQVQKESRPGGSLPGGPTGLTPEFIPSAEGSGDGSWSAFEGGSQDIGQCIQRAGIQLKATLEGLQDVNRRLYQLEEILASKAALTPLTNRIKSVRSSLEQQVHSMRSQESFWSKLTTLFHEKGIQFKTDEPIQGRHLPVDPSNGSGPSAGVTRDTAAGASTPRRTQRDQVCLINLAGRRVAVLSANVVKVQPVNGKKVANISKRGYGLLKDFKPLFKGIKSGLFGTWIGLPTDVLKAYQFMPVNTDALNIETPAAADIKGAVLVSNGKQHGIIWSESGSVDLRTETIELTADSSPILGWIRLDHGEEIQVLHVDHLLETTHQEENGR